MFHYNDGVSIMLMANEVSLFLSFKRHLTSPKAINPKAIRFKQAQ